MRHIAILDSGFLYATTDKDDAHYHAATETLKNFRGRLILPVTILVETAYLIHAHLGHSAMRRFVGKLSATSLQFESLTPADISRIHELLDIYNDMELDFVDASVVAIAERLNIRHVMTVDQRDFRVVRPRHCEYFDILPQ